MAILDLNSDISIEIEIPNATQVSDEIVGSAVDMLDYIGLSFISQCSGLNSPGGIIFTMEHSDSGLPSDFTEVDAQDTIGSLEFIEVDSPEVSSVGYLGKKRYVRVVKPSGTPIGKYYVNSLRYKAKSGETVSPGKVVKTGAILQENGFAILQENGFTILV